MRRAGWGRGVIAYTAFIALVGCGGGEEETEASDDGDVTSGPMATSEAGSESSGTQIADPVELTRASAWELADENDDPFPTERPDWVQCEIGFDVVTNGFEVDTGLCVYGAFMQPTLAPIAEGDEIELVITRGVPSEPASGHLAIAFGEEIVFETSLEPSDEDITEARWVATTDVPVASPVHLHLHDDGPNTYRVASFVVIGRE